jgi:hypothetical protein
MRSTEVRGHHFCKLNKAEFAIVLYHLKECVAFCTCLDLLKLSSSFRLDSHLNTFILIQPWDLRHFWGITQGRVVILYRRFGTTYLSRLQGSISQRRAILPHEPHRNHWRLRNKTCMLCATLITYSLCYCSKVAAYDRAVTELQVRERVFKSGTS